MDTVRNSALRLCYNSYMNKRYILIVYRIFFALLGLSAVVTEIAIIVERGRFVPANFFSFFTIESNLLAILVLIISALVLARGKQGRLVAMLRGASTLNMIIVGVVFSLLLSGLEVELTAAPWDNIVLHYILPVVVSLDWLMDTPKLRVAFRQTFVWMVFPVVYVVYSLIRGYFVGWYPYPFLDPNNHGYGGVAITSIILLLGTAGLAWLLAWSTRRKVSTKK